MMNMYKSVAYQGEQMLEVEVYPQLQHPGGGGGGGEGEVKEIRIEYLSQASERCPPLAVLHTITPCGIRFKMESKHSISQDTPLHLLHSSCIRDNKTAVMPLGAEELHFVAMYSRNDERPCFWDFNAATVANTMRSFEDKIEALQRKISTEVDPQCAAGMLAEVYRCQEDKTILKQYAEMIRSLKMGK